MRNRIKRIILVYLALTVLTPGPGGTAAAPGAEAGPSAVAPAKNPRVIRDRLIPPKRPVRAIQVIRFDCASLDEVAARLDEWKAAGVNTVIMRVFHNEGDGYYRFITPAHQQGVYFQTKKLPVVADALSPVTELAHARGMLLIAWMTSRYANYGHEGREDFRAWQWNPKSGMTPAKGWCPLLPETAEFMAGVYEDLAAYPIDGILIQDDLILRHHEGYNQRAIELYRRETGREADPSRFYKNPRLKNGRLAVDGYTEEFQAWRRWCAAKLIRFAERARAGAQSRRPTLPVGMNLYYETLTDPGNALNWFGQDRELVLASRLDFHALMLYHRQMSEELGTPVDGVFRRIENSLPGYLAVADFPERVWVKAQCVDWNGGKPIPPRELIDLFSRCGRSGNLGRVIIPAPRSLNLEMVKEIMQ